MDYLTVNEIAKTLNLSKKTIRKLFHDKVLKGKMMGRKYVTTKKLLDEFIESSDK